MTVTLVQSGEILWGVDNSLNSQSAMLPFSPLLFHARRKKEEQQQEIRVDCQRRVIPEMISEKYRIVVPRNLESFLRGAEEVIFDIKCLKKHTRTNVSGLWPFLGCVPGAWKYLDERKNGRARGRHPRATLFLAPAISKRLLNRLDPSSVRQKSFLRSRSATLLAESVAWRRKILLLPACRTICRPMFDRCNPLE